MKRALLLLAACSGQTGTLHVSLVTAPGSHVLDAAETLRLVVTKPHRVVLAKRGGDGFSIALDLPADGTQGQLIVDALDAGGTVIATGETPPFSEGGIEANLAVYMAPPNSIGAAPVALAAARTGVAVGSLGYGAVIAGGRDASGAATADLVIYNGYTHAFLAGKAMPQTRADQALGVGANGAVYLFGGSGDVDPTTDDLWRFDTTVAPAGAYADLGRQMGFARAGELAIPIGNDAFLITGTPPAQLDGIRGTMTMITDVGHLPHRGASVVASDGVTTALFTGGLGTFRYRAGAFDMPPIAGAGDAVVAVPGGAFVIACGTADATRVDAATEVATPLPGVPGVAKTGCAVAATSRHLVIAGGTLNGGGVDGNAQIFDAQTFAPVATLPLVVPRTGAFAIALDNDQILIAGGVDATGAPIATLELFTPDSPE